MANKTKQSRIQRPQKQTTTKRSNLPLIIAAAVIVCAAAAAVTLNLGGGNSVGSEAQTIQAGDSLVIPVSEITETARFYPLEVDGTEMEVLAVRASDGSVRTAFNTCQSCFTSGRGYYVQKGDDLVCQNCGFHFTPDQVEIQSGGCNPWPIFSMDKTVTEESIEISYDFLSESSSIFANWRI